MPKAELTTTADAVANALKAADAAVIELPPMVRFLTSDIAVEERAESAGRLRFSASSEAPVERGFGTEILSHEAGAIRMHRIETGAAPLLFNHVWNDAVGMLTGAKVENGRLMVEANLFDTARAKEVAAMVRGGLRNVSIGYQLHVVEEQKRSGEFIARDWEPIEVSIVTVPADPSVGIGRESGSKHSVRVLRADSPAAPATTTPEVRTMSENTQAGTPADAPVVTDGSTQERLRIKSITALARQHRIDDKQRDEWIDSGKSVDEVSQRVLDVIAERTARNPETSAKLDLSAKDMRKYSMLRAINAVIDRKWDKAGFELECSREIAERLQKTPNANTFFIPFDVQTQKRDAIAATASAGGYLVAQQNQSFVEILRNRSVAFAMGARRLSGLRGNITIPKQTGATTAYWLGTEATSITESQPAFAQISMSPHTVGAYTEVSRQLMLQASPDIEGLVNSDLAAVVAIEMDRVSIRGSGGGGEPLGIINVPNCGTTTATSVDYGKVLDFQKDLAAANIRPSSGGYVTTSAIAGLLMGKQRFTSTDTPLWEGTLWDGTMCGYRAMSSEQMSSATMLFGDWSELVIGEWGVLEVEVNPAANFAAGIIGIRAMYTVDVAVRRAEAFSYSSSVT
jgi:HK97 family phage major capsid protein/HK97 family phage prohead protease